MENSLIKPRRLRQCDTIGIAAPAGCVDEKRLLNGVRILEEAGFSVKVPEGILERNGYLAGNDKARADQLMSLFLDPSVHGILCARGGFGSSRILPFLDFDVISANPKAFIGFSDITVLLAAFYTKSRLLTFHGPLATTLGNGSEKTRKSFLDAITSNAVIRLAASEPVVLQSGKATGRILGGNLINLCHLIGTPYEPDWNGAILFIEEHREAPYRIDRMLCHLKLSDRLSRLSGVVLGAFSECGETFLIHDLIKEYFANRDIPIVGGFEIGHIDDNMTIPVGLTAELDADNGELAFQETATL